MKIRNLSLLVIAIFVISLTAIAQPGNRPQQWENLSPEQKAIVMKKWKDKQKTEPQNFFTEEQKEAIKKIHFNTAKKVKPLRNELLELTAHQKTLTTADNADLEAINKNIDKMSGIKADIAKIMAKQHQEIRSLLDEEQLLKFDALKGNFRNGMRGDVRKQGMRIGDRPAFDDRI